MKTEKIKAAQCNNRKHIIHIEYLSGKKVEVHYSQLGILKNILKIWVDKETRGKSIGILLENGQEEYMPYDQALALVKDPEYQLQNQIERLIAHIKEALKKKKVSKRYLAEKLKTSDNQIQRLLNPKILNKNLEQLYGVAALLGLELEWTVTSAA